ncbi:MAG: hypothetical protein ACRDRO_21640 [Pseudonocardiaceae bacterium]
MSATHDLVNDLLARDPAVYQRYLLDAEYHARVTLLRKMLEITEQAMTAEDVAQDVRRRVLHTVVYGATADLGERTQPWARSPDR